MITGKRLIHPCALTVVDARLEAAALAPTREGGIPAFSLVVNDTHMCAANLSSDIKRVRQIAIKHSEGRAR